MSSLLNEAEYDGKNYTDQGGCYRPRWITASEISIILHLIRRPNTIIVLLLIQNISNFLTSLLPRSLLHSRFLESATVGRSFVSAVLQTNLLVDFIQNFGLFLCTVSGDKQIYFLADIPQKVR